MLVFLLVARMLRYTPKSIESYDLQVEKCH